MSDEQLDLFKELGDLVAACLRAPSSATDAARGVVWLARKRLPYDEVGITVRDGDGTLSTLAYTDPLVERLDDLQYTLGEGPTLQSLKDDADLVVADLTNHPNWQRWGQSATELGIHGVHTVRLSPFAGHESVLVLYSSAPCAIAREDFDLARLFAHEASMAIRVTHEVWHLNRAMNSRTIIGQAEGVLMNRFQLDADQAFAVLKRVSSQTNRKLHAVAADLVGTGQLPSVDARIGGMHHRGPETHAV